MELEKFIQIGASSGRKFTVLNSETAENVGSGGFKVLATPILVAYLERVAYEMLQKALPSGYSSVGAHISLDHLAPTPIGGEVKVRCTVTEISGRWVTFRVELEDNFERVGEATHKRVVVNTERFQERIAGKEPS